MPTAFKSKWVDYIESEFDSREEGHWFMNNGKPTTLLAHIICTYNGQQLMWGIQIIEKLTEYSIFFGKRVKLISELLE